MNSSDFYQWLDELKNWFGNLSHTQVGVMGGILGYIVGVITGPLLQLSLTLIVLVAFGFLSRTLQNKFESRLGITGAVAVMLAVSSLGGVQDFFGDVVGQVLMYSSKFVLALVVAHFALYLHSSVRGQTETES